MKTAQALVTLGFGSALTLAAPLFEEANAGVARRQPSPTSELDRRDDWDWDDRFGGYMSDLSDRFEDIFDFDRRDLSASKLSARNDPEDELAPPPSANDLPPTGHGYDHDLRLGEPAEALPGHDNRLPVPPKLPVSLAPPEIPGKTYTAGHSYDHHLNTGELVEAPGYNNYSPPNSPTSLDPPNIVAGLYPAGRGYDHDLTDAELSEALHSYLDGLSTRKYPPAPHNSPDHELKQAPPKKTVSGDLHTSEKRYIPNIDRPMHARIARPSIKGMGKMYDLHA